MHFNESIDPGYHSIPKINWDHFGVDVKRNGPGDHFGVGIISGSIWGSFRGAVQCLVSGICQVVIMSSRGGAFVSLLIMPSLYVYYVLSHLFSK